MPRSMTGFGVADGPVGGGRLQVEIRTVNHRHLNVQLKLPADLQRLDGEFRELVRRAVERGQVTVITQWVAARAHPSMVRLNLDRARELVGALRELKAALSLPGEIDLAFVARQPEVLTLGEGVDAAPEWAEVAAVSAQALAGVGAMREREGRALGTELAYRLQVIERDLGTMEARAPQRVVLERDRLRRAVGELLEGRPLDEHRLAQEIAILADRLDITEETVRLRAHLVACREMLDRREAVGRQLGFLGQEMLREINTMGSKANDGTIAQLVIGMKGELEKFREQVENVE